MTDPRPSPRPRRLLLHVAVLLATALFVTLGLWQLRRHEARAARNARFEAQLALPAAPYAELIVALGAADPGGRRATVVGRYDPDRELLLRGRSLQGEPGWHVLTPLRLDAHRALLVDRGWIPIGLDTPPIAPAVPPVGPVELSGRLLAERDPPTGPLVPRDPPEGPLTIAFYVDADRLAAQFPYALEPYYLELEGQAPPQAGELPVPPPPPELTRGSHLGYALQWFSFAVIAVVGYAVLLRRSARDGAEPPAA